MSEPARKIDLSTATVADLRHAVYEAELVLVERRKKLKLAEQAVSFMGPAVPLAIKGEIDACRKNVEATETEIAGLQAAVEVRTNADHALFDKTDRWR